jgi:hypothetical protein
VVVTTADAPTPTVDVTMAQAPGATTTTVVVTTTTAAPAELAHGQAVPVPSQEQDFFPPHPPRTETVEYNATHHLLIGVLDTPCRICGVRRSTLGDPIQNRFNAKDLETHHYPIQREYTDACDWRKVARDFSQVVDQASFLKFVDSPANMWVICDVHHRGERDGIHHTVTNDWIIHRYLLEGYVLTDRAANAAVDLAKDEAIVDAAVPLAERL